MPVQKICYKTYITRIMRMVCFYMSLIVSGLNEGCYYFDPLNCHRNNMPYVWSSDFFV